MKRRMFLKALMGTLSGAAALPFVKLPKNTWETKKGYETTTNTANEGAHTHHVGVYDPSSQHSHQISPYNPSDHNHWVNPPPATRVIDFEIDSQPRTPSWLPSDWVFVKLPDGQTLYSPDGGTTFKPTD